MTSDDLDRAMVQPRPENLAVEMAPKALHDSSLTAAAADVFGLPGLQFQSASDVQR